MTYDSAFDQSRRFGSALAKEGLAKGDVLAIHLPNCPQYLTAVLGTIGIIYRLRASNECIFGKIQTKKEFRSIGRIFHLLRLIMIIFESILTSFEASVIF